MSCFTTGSIEGARAKANDANVVSQMQEQHIASALNQTDLAYTGRDPKNRWPQCKEYVFAAICMIKEHLPKCLNASKIIAE